MGRPSDYNEEIGKKICEAISTSTKGIHRLFEENDDFPHPATVFRWLLNEELKDFREQYARAREAQADFMAEEILKVAYDSSRDKLRTKKVKDEETGEDVFLDEENKEFVNRSRLKVDSLKWLASKLAPKKYGDKVDLTSLGEKLNSVSVEIIKPIEEE